MGEEIDARVEVTMPVEDTEIIQLKKRRSDLLEQKIWIRERVIYRANPVLKNLKREHYESTIISLGLFDRCSWDRCKGVAKEKDPLKIDVLIEFLADIGKEPDDWPEISKEVVHDARAMESLYGQSFDPRQSEETIRSALALDSIFVTCFLMLFVVAKEFPEIYRMTRRTNIRLTQEDSNFLEEIYHDIKKMENQIPLVLIRNVLAITFCSLNVFSVEQSPVDKALQIMCSRVLSSYELRLPSCVQLTTHDADIQNHHHLLHFTAEAFWYSGNGQNSKKDQSDAGRQSGNRHDSVRNRHLPTATELHVRGVKFEGQDGFFPRFMQTRFMWWPRKATLFLPKIKNIDDGTELYWRNILAFENISQSTLEEEQRQSLFQDYFVFMDMLINTKKDVSFLLDGKNPVILTVGIGDHQAIANLFNSMMENIYFASTDEWLSLIQDISDFHNHTAGKRISEFWNTYFSKPWALISAFAATVLLGLTLLQTIYTVLYHD